MVGIFPSNFYSNCFFLEPNICKLASYSDWALIEPNLCNLADSKVHKSVQRFFPFFLLINGKRSVLGIFHPTFIPAGHF